MFQAFFYFFYKPIHELGVKLFKNVIFLNRLIPTLPINIEQDIKKFSTEYYSYYPMIKEYKNKNIINYSIADNYIFENPLDITSERDSKYEELIFSEVFIAELGPCIIDCSSGFVISKKTKSVFSQSSIWGKQGIASKRFYESLIPKKSLQIVYHGTYFPEINNYYHWYGEFLLRLLYFQKNNKDSLIYTRQFKYNWQWDTLKYFDADISRIKFIDSNKDYLSSKNYLYQSFFGSPSLINPKAIELLKEIIIKKQNSLNDEKPKRRIFISRDKAKHRRIVNDSEFKLFLSTKYDFEILDFEDFTIEEQYAVFNQAEIIISIHGPALTNVIACSNAKIIELYNEKHIVECFAHICFSLKLPYHALLCKSIGEPRIINKKPFYGYNDIKIDISRLDNILQIIM